MHRRMERAQAPDHEATPAAPPTTTHRERRPRRGEDFGAPRSRRRHAEGGDAPRSSDAGGGAREGGGPRLSDRALFEQLQQGGGTGDFATPVASDAPASAAGPDSGAPPRREARPRRPRRGEREVEPPAAGSTRLWVNLGTEDRLESSSLASALEGLGAPAGKVSRVSMMRSFTYVDVSDDAVAAFQELAGKRHQEKVVKIEVARR
jgi:hypothetical protein